MDAFNFVFREYCDPRRTYHNLDHIMKMLKGVHCYAPEYVHGEEIDTELYLAILFHDFEYSASVVAEKLEPSNEVASAIAFEHWHMLECPMDEHGYYGDPIVPAENIRQMILATEHHFDGTEFEDRKTNVLLDLDLLSFADSFPSFCITQKSIDDEFNPYYDRKMVAEKRTAFLRSILETKSLKYRVIDPNGTLTKTAYRNITDYLYIYG